MELLMIYKISPHPSLPAYAEAASRRQAKEGKRKGRNASFDYVKNQRV